MQNPHRQRPTSQNHPWTAWLFFALILGIQLLSGCDGASGRKEFVYVAAPEATLRDKVATIYNKTGVVYNGDRLLVLERMPNKRFVRVRTPRGEEGWLQERFLTDQSTFDQFQKMAEQYRATPAQGTATVQQEVNVHVLPGRKTGFIYQLNEKQKVELLQRRPIDRNALPLKDDKPKDKDSETESDDDEADKPGQPVIWEDWWLVRDSQQRVGWVRGRVLYLEVPDEIAQYAEGQRIVAAYKLDDVQDQDRKVGEYLVLFTEPKDGASYDFSQARVYTWNLRKHRYETAYRERNLDGHLPVTLGKQDFGKEGNLRTFTLNLKDSEGQPRQQLYKFNPPMVRRVLAPGETPPPKIHKKKK